MKLVPALPLLLLAGASLTFAQPPRLVAPAAVWKVSQETNTADAFGYTRFTLVGRFLSAAHGDTAERPALVVDCIPSTGPDHGKGKLLAANLLVGTQLTIKYVEPEEIHGMSYLPKIAVRYRLDEAGSDTRENWPAGTQKTSASVSKDTLKHILRAHTVAITVDDDRGSALPMLFSLPDPASVEQGCNVD